MFFLFFADIDSSKVRNLPAAHPNHRPFEKVFYTAHDEITDASKTQINKLLGELGIRIQGYQPQRPISSFGHLNFPERLLVGMDDLTIIFLKFDIT